MVALQLRDVTSDLRAPNARAMWVPLIAVIAVLLALVIAPIGVNAHARRERARITDVIDPARLRSTDLSAFLAEEMFIVGTHPRGAGAPRDSLYLAAFSAERRDVLALDSL